MVHPLRVLFPVCTSRSRCCLRLPIHGVSMAKLIYPFSCVVAYCLDSHCLDSVCKKNDIAMSVSCVLLRPLLVGFVVRQFCHNLCVNCLHSNVRQFCDDLCCASITLVALNFVHLRVNYLYSV